MEFNLKGFMSTKFTTREQDVPVPGLKAFFGESQPVWRVRGLDSAELAKVDASAEAAKNMLAIAEGLVSADQKEKTEALRELLGLSGEVPQETVKRIELLTLGSVKPAITRDVAVKLADTYPIELKILTGTIMQLTGMGKQPGKLPGSGETRASEPPSTTATSGGASSTKPGRTSSRKGS